MQEDAALFTLCLLLHKEQHAGDSLRAPVPPCSQKTQDQDTRALQHSPSSGPAHPRQGETAGLFQPLSLPVKSVLGNEVGEAAGGNFRAALSLAAC